MDLLLTNNPDTFILIQLHYHDDYHTEWADLRGGYFDVSSTPTAWFDGVDERRGSSFDIATDFLAFQSMFQARRSTPTDVTIDMTGERVSDNAFEVTARVCVEPTGTTKDLRILMNQVLDNWPASPNYSRNGFKEKSGADNVTLTPGECFDANRFFSFDADSVAQWDDIRIIAWAEAPLAEAPAEVYQAASYRPPPPPEPIPTVSTWGVAVMTGFMLIAATLTIRRRVTIAA